MCEPVTTGLAIVSAVGSGAAAVGNYVAQRKASRDLADNAADALRQNYGDSNQRAVQEQAQTSDAVRRIQRQVQAAQGQTLALTGAAGVTGQSVSQAIAQLTADGSEQISTLETNLDTTLGQIERQKAGQKAAANNRASQIAPPSLLVPALQIGGSALELADRLKRQSQKPGETR